MLSRDYCQRPDTRNLLGTSGNIFEVSSARVESTTPAHSGMLHGTNPISKFDGSVFSGTVKPVARSEEVNKDTIPTPRFARKSSTCPHGILPSHAERVYPQKLYCWIAKTPNLGTAFRQIPYTFHVFVLEDKIQHRSMCLFRFTLGGDVMDQRSRDCRFSGRSQVVALNSGISFPWFRDAGREDCLSPEQDHPEFLLQEEGQSRGAESSIAGSISSRTTDGCYDLRILPSYLRSWYCSWLFRTIQYYSSQRWCSGVRYEMGRKFLISEQDSHRRCFGKFVQISNTWVWATQNRVGTVRAWNSSENIEAGLSEIENHGEEKYRSKDQSTKLWSQKWENRDKSSGKESQGSTTCCARIRRMLSMESKKTAFKRRQLKFPQRRA